jgi:hypothetical protein
MTTYTMEQPICAAPHMKPLLNYALWTVQILLALLFLFTSGLKLILPIEVLTSQMPLPGPFVRFIGLCEGLGAIGLILPWALRVRKGLTPLAAAGLAIIMIGATALNLATAGAATALVTLTLGILLGCVAYFRRMPAEEKNIVTHVDMESLHSTHSSKNVLAVGGSNA